MSAEAEVEAMAMPYSVRVPNANAESMDAGSQEGTEAIAMVIPPSAEILKASLPVLDLLHWSESPCPNPSRIRISATNNSSAFMNASDERPFLRPPVRSEVRTSQPAGGISTISLGENLTLEESEQLQKRRPASDSKRREMIGSGIFETETVSELTPDHLAKIPLVATRMVTPHRASNNTNMEGLDLSPKKPASLSEVAKQRELSGTFFGATGTPAGRRPCSSAKSRELEGSNIFGRSTQDQLNAVSPKVLASDFHKSARDNYQENYAPPRTSVKVSNPAGGRSQISFGCDGGGPQFGMQSKKQEHGQKAVELSGHNLLKGEANIVSSINTNSTSPCERMVSAAKRRELLGNDIFSDASPVATREHPRRGRQPPGGESNLKLL